jgi:hypothetical protein
VAGSQKKREDMPFHLAVPGGDLVFLENRDITGARETLSFGRKTVHQASLRTSW